MDSATYILEILHSTGRAGPGHLEDLSKRSMTDESRGSTTLLAATAGFNLDYL